MHPLSIAVLGGGFVGTTTAAVLAEQGHNVELVEPDPARRSGLEHARPTFHEPGLADALALQLPAGRLRVRARVCDVGGSDLLLVCVGTPPHPNGSTDLSQVSTVAHEVAEHLARSGGRPAVAVKSTVPPGTTRGVVGAILEDHLGPGAVPLASNPEFLREGTALADARRPSRIVVGSLDDRATAALRRAYAAHTCPFVETTGPEAAELAKYAANAMLATRIAYANEIANLCERVGVHVEEVVRAIALDPRIGPHFLEAGCGFGGSCFPKDIASLVHEGRRHGTRLRLVEEVLAHNERQPERLVSLAEDVLGPLRGRRVAILGLAFKPETSDVRGSRALVLYEALVRRGAQVIGHDPIAAQAFGELVGEGARVTSDLDEALEGADVLLVQTAWDAYARLDPLHARRLMRTAVAVDGRRVLDGESFREAGFVYRSIGRPPPDVTHPAPSPPVPAAPELLGELPGGSP